jgi:hypothetical protein
VVSTGTARRPPRRSAYSHSITTDLDHHLDAVRRGRVTTIAVWLLWWLENLLSDAA